MAAWIGDERETEGDWSWVVFGQIVLMMVVLLVIGLISAQPVHP